MIALTGCGSPTELTDYSARGVSSSNTPSKWSDSDLPLQLMISSDFDSDESVAIGDMASKWTSAANSSTNFIESYDASAATNNYSNLDDYNDGVVGVYKVDNWYDDLPPTALAVTQIFGSFVGSQIRIDHADILINYEYFEFSAGNSYGYDLQTVVLHEMGHLLGLYHNFDLPDDSIMYPSISRFDIKRDLLEYDIQNIQEKYNFSYSESNQDQILNPKTNLWIKIKTHLK